MGSTRLQISRLVYGVAVVAIFAWAAWLRFNGPLEPVADSDVWGYLLPAVSKLSGDGFVHAGRNFVYPAFIFVLLRAAGDFRIISVAQHCLGLAAGGLMLAAWLHARKLVRGATLPLAFHRWLGLFPVGIYLFAADTIRLELEIRPEGVCGFLGMLNLFLLVRFTEHFFVRRETAAAMPCAIGLIFSAVVFGSVRPSFWLAALSSLVPLLFVFVRAGSREKIATATAAVAAVVLIIIPERVLARGDDVDATFLPTLLFAQHADIIADQMAADLSSSAEPPYGRSWLNRIHNSLTAEIERSRQSPRPYPSLGFDPEYLMYAADSIDAQLRQEFHDDVNPLCRFYRFYYVRAFLHQPGRMLWKIGQQVGIFYGPRCGAFNWGRWIDLQADYQQSWRETSSSPDRFRGYRPALEFVNRSGALMNWPLRLEQRPYIRYPLYALSKRYVLCLVAALVLALIIFARTTTRHRWGWLAGLMLFLYWHSFVTCVETALVNSLEVYRYLSVQLSFVVLAQFMTALVLLEVATGGVAFLGAKFRRANGRDGEAGPSKLPRPENSSH